MTTQLKRQRIVLDIVYGANEKTVAPADWEWWRILDGHDLEAASAVLATEVVEMEKTEHGALLSICDTPRFDQKFAPELLGTVGVLQRVVPTENEYALHKDHVYINLTQGQNACVYISQQDGDVKVEVLDTSAPPVMEPYKSIWIEKHEFDEDNEENHLSAMELHPDEQGDGDN